MNCPDIDRILELRAGGDPPPELAAHLESCASCRADLFVIRELRAALRPEIEVPEELIERTLAAIFGDHLQAPPRTSPRTAPLAQILVHGLLASATAAAAVVATGTRESLATHIFFSLAVGAVSMGLQLRESPRAPPAAT